MREILFRGKDYNGKWHFSMTISKHYYNDIEIFSYYIGHGTTIIDAKTLGQYTGLTDKNGTKIFEGDIVEGLDFTAEDGGYGVVAFDDGAFEVVGICYNNIVGTFHENYYGKDFEVIGNIHDNPELLKGEQQ
jgi:uncharacterized phage protein (TIGR01671 family)